MLKEKKGVYATRSPHRANPIGITLARIEGVDKKKRRLMLSSCDLIDETPIFDIKPFVGMYDSAEDAVFPPWIVETINTRNTVKFHDDGIKVDRLKKKLKQYKNEPDAYLQGLRETLEADVRSKFQPSVGWKTRRRIFQWTFHFVGGETYGSHGCGPHERSKGDATAGSRRPISYEDAVNHCRSCSLCTYKSASIGKRKY